MAADNDDEKLAVLMTVFESVDPQKLAAALAENDGDVDKTVNALLAPSPAAHPTNPKQKKRAVSITNFFDPTSSKRRAADTPSTTAQTSPSFPSPVSTSPSASEPLKNAFEILRNSPQVEGPLPPKQLTASSISEHVPCELIYDALPKELADVLLGRMLQEAESWEIHRFVLFEKEVASPHTSSFYTEPVPAHSSSAETGDSLPDTEYYYGGRKQADVRIMPPEAARARDIVEQIVNERMDARDGGKRHEAEIVGRWKANVVLGNCYRGGAQAVGPHMDKLTYLGPRPTIGSLTLGATRPFRIRRIARPGGPPSQTYNVLLPHNSLLIMFPPMQEEYRHEVPKIQPTRLTPHPLSRDTRINLTFRASRREYRESIPLCRCGNPSELRCVIKQEGNLGRYFHMCGGGGNPDRGIDVGHNCGFFQWLDLEEMNRKARVYAAELSSATAGCVPSDGGMGECDEGAGKVDDVKGEVLT
ncbi:hypothetical protein HK104_011460 [Borealophlyctis nickersoniae]|nr:hypothetical protein HK104_011460 [Borealophlyctis nickersoniae]